MPSEIPQQQRLFLERVHIQGFKSIEDLQTNLQKGLNILIGKNGAGKSNFLECLYNVITVTANRQASFKAAWVEIKSPDKHLFRLEFIRNAIKSIENDRNLKDKRVITENLMIDGTFVYSNASKEEKNNTVTFNDRKIILNDDVWRIIARLGYYYPLFPLYIKFNIPEKLDCIEKSGTLTIPHSATENWSRPESLEFINYLFFRLEVADAIHVEKGATVKDWLAKHLKIDYKIIENLKRYTPIQDLHFNANINIYNSDKAIIVDNLKLDFKVNGNWLPWSQLSDGTKRLFYIIAEISNLKEGLVLIEEPELGVHPHQFNLLMDFLKEQAVDKQIIISTHAPKALDHLSPDELDHIMIASYTSKKGTQINPLNRAQKKKALAYMKEVGFLSDYWMLSDLEK